MWDHLRTAADRRQAAGLHRQLNPRPPATERTAIDCASNDYLSLSHHPDVIAAAVEATETWGTTAGASRLVTGALQLHADAELALCALTGAPTALLFSSGYLANLAVLTALTDDETLVLSDEQNHASLIDGCRLSRAEVRVYRHNDVDHVAALLAEHPPRRAVVVTDAVFSVDGDRAPLGALYEVATAHDAALIVDEAHSIGVIGAGGQGAVWETGLAAAENVVVTATLSKSLAAQGGAVLAPEVVRNHLVNAARSFIFDTGLAPAPTAAARQAAVELMATPRLAERVRDVAQDLHERGLAAGWEGTEPEAAVVSFRVETPERAVAAQRACADAGVNVGCFRPPSVPDEFARIRLTAHAGMTDDELAVVGEALRHAREATS